MLCKPKFRVVMLSEEEYNVLKRALERLELGDIAETETFRNLRARISQEVHTINLEIPDIAPRLGFGGKE